VSVDNLFENYRRWILNETPFGSVAAELESISLSAAIHRRLVEQRPDDVLGRFGRFAKAFDVSTAMPLVLYLATEAELGENLGVAVDIIEAFILRRDICGLTTKNYNKLFVEVLDKIRKSEQPPLIELERQLSLGQTDIGRWPDDQEWRDAWMGRDQYKANRQGRLRFLFEAIEKRKRTALSEDIEIKSELTVEHIMPQQWRTHWPVPGIARQSGREVRDNLDENLVSRRW
jgi:hypothetical protein